MPNLRDIIADLKLIKDGLDAMSTIINALNDTKRYVKSVHPDVHVDLVNMLTEMKKTLETIEKASSTITRFRFIVGGNTPDEELRRFNNLLIERSEAIAKIKPQLRSMKGSSGKIREAANRVESKSKNFWVNLVRSNARASRYIHRLLEEAHTVDNDWLMWLEIMERNLDYAIKDIQDELGPAGMMDPKNIAKAANTLGKYQTQLDKLEAKVQELADEIEKTITTLTH